ncbi:MAG: glycoside hydrolase family 13 protein [Gaiellaceae bacterium]
MTVVGTEAPATLLERPHHDGSDAYVLARPDELGGAAAVRLRVPRGVDVDDVVLRSVQDGEPRHVRAVVDTETDTDVWYRADFRVENPSVRYRWLLSGGAVGYAWLNGLGLAGHDLADADDFVLTVDPGGPEWHLGSVAYEIFPDRFASNGLEVEPPAWAVRRKWDELPTGRGRATPAELFGGDLRGAEARLEHVERLGADLIYLTPFFPAGSTHRYDATSFEHVDPLLGGDEALTSLLRAAHARGMRVLGDLTLNHSGVGHDWFTAERDHYFFDESLPHGYASWFGVKSLPKLNWTSETLRGRMQAVARRWLELGLDGWRIDVANMTGRHRDVDLAHQAARTIRAVLRPDDLLVAEHGHDFRDDLAGGGWHGTMNYAGFLRPAWEWLRGDAIPAELERSFWGTPVGLPRLGGRAVTATMQAFRAGVPWQSVLHSWNLLDSHDTARFRTVSGSRERHEVGIGLQMTMPGVPMVFAGDELGLEGAWGEDARRTMPWDRLETWDEGLLSDYARLISLRKSSPALQRGGLRYVHVGEDALVYLRELGAERLLCLAARTGHDPVRIPLAALGCRSLEAVVGGDAAIVDDIATLPGDGPAFHVWRIDG